jgi:hypothetical protein
MRTHTEQSSPVASPRNLRNSVTIGQVRSQNEMTQHLLSAALELSVRMDTVGLEAYISNLLKRRLAENYA